MNRAELKEKIIDEIAGGYQMVQMTDGQIDSAINKALKSFWYSHIDGSFRSILSIPTASLESNSIQFTSDTSILAVSKMLDKSEFNVFYAGFLQSYSFRYMPLNMQYQHGSGEVEVGLQMQLFDYTLMDQYNNLVNETVDPKPMYEYNSLTRKLTIFDTLKNLRRYKRLGFIVYEKVPEDLVFEDDQWFVPYVVGLCRKKYAANLMKWNEEQPDGGTLNFQGMMDLADKEIEEGEEKLNTIYNGGDAFLAGR